MAAETVYLLGAGFSKAVSGEMPTLLGLGELLRPKLEGIFDPKDWRVELGTKDFEGLLSLISQDQPWLDDPTNLRNRAAFIDLSRTIGKCIRKCQVSALKTRMPTRLSRLVDHWVANNTKILTFNYDTLIEKAYVSQLDGLLKLAEDYSHESLYPVVMSAVEHRASGSGPPGRLPGDGIRLVKLHGSLNWYYSGAEDFFGEVIYDVGIKPEWGSSDQDKAVSKAHFVLDKMPLIVPPTSSKNSFFANETVRGNWRSARSYLGDAHELVVVGYSLPPSDLMARGLLADSRLERIVLVDKDPCVAERYSQALPDVTIDESFINTTDNPLEHYVHSL